MASNSQAPQAHEYTALEVQQQPEAPLMYITEASAADLLMWSDVPRGQGDYMAGYQRPLEGGRTLSITSYLEQSPLNIVPGAIVIAVDSDYVSVDPQEGPIVRLTIREDSRSFEERLLELYGQFTTRLSAEELASAAIPFSNHQQGSAHTTTGEAAEPQNQAEEDEESSEYPTSYLAALAKELQAAVSHWDSVPERRKKAITDFINATSKPGLIIDGQHRVFGAKNVSAVDVHLPVVLVPGLKISEQVFQFYVLNSKARPLKPTQLRRIVSTSLTNEEINALYTRFREAGVEAEEAKWTYELNTSPLSPFRNRIDFGFGIKGAIIRENVADQLVRAFMRMPRSKYSALIDPLGNSWANQEQRLERFFAFWTAIKSQYPAAWREAEEQADQGNLAQLFMKVSLLTLQTFLLDRFVTALPFRRGRPAPLQTDTEIADMVSSVLENLPQTFFRKEWKAKQIDTTEGRRMLYEAMEKVWSNQGRNIGNLRLFRE